MKLNIVTFETSKLLKDFGFDIICPQCYGTAIIHNGEYLGYDEKYELRAEGRGDEIKYVDGMLYNMWFKNNDKEDHNIYALVSRQLRLSQESHYFSGGSMSRQWYVIHMKKQLIKKLLNY